LHRPGRRFFARLSIAGVARRVRPPSRPLGVILVFLGLRAQNIQSVVLALAVVNWMITARLVRGEVVLLKKQDYVRAARARGAAPSRAGTSFPTPSGSCSWRSSSSSRR
jgi:ABC-type dipeptide/oligopeptide/nickel transport system permease component